MYKPYTTFEHITATVEALIKGHQVLYSFNGTCDTNFIITANLTSLYL